MRHDESSTLDPASIAPHWAAVQDAAMRIARIRRHENIARLAGRELGTWIGLQRRDLDDGAAEIEDRIAAAPAGALPDAVLQKVRGKIGDLQARTETMEATHREAATLLQGLEATFRDLQEARRLKEAGDADGLERTGARLQAAVADLEALWEQLEPRVAADRIDRILASARSGERPIRQVLAASLKELQPAPSRTDPPPASRPVSDPPRDAGSPSGQAPRRPPAAARPRNGTSLGRQLSSYEIEHVTLEFFSTLWERGADPARVGDILFHAPSTGEGMTVHDLLAFAGGRDRLRDAMPELIARYPAKS